METPELWRHIFVGMRTEETLSWNLIWHLYAMSDNALTAAQLARRMHIPEDGVIRLMNAMGADVAEKTGWSQITDREDVWQIYFSRRRSSSGEWVYSIQDKFLPILNSLRQRR